MISKANQRVGMIKRSFSKLNWTGFKVLYKSLVRPILEYCSVIWFPIYKTDALEIEKVQKRATKLLHDLKDLPYPERLRKLNLTTLVYRRQRTDILQVFRIIKQIDKIPIESLFTLNLHPTRGHSFQLEKPRPRPQTQLRENSFSNRVINIWNKLSEESVQCLNIEDNKTAINKFKDALELEWKRDPIKYDFEEYKNIYTSI